MTIRIDDDTHTLSLSIRDLAADETTMGSISAEAMPAARAALGREAHTTHQHARTEAHPGYQSEVLITHTFECDTWTVKAQGRMDGVYRLDEANVVEEIKSVRSIDHAVEKLNAGAYRAWTLQLRLYMLFLGRESGLTTHGDLVLVEIRAGAGRAVRVALDQDELEAAVTARVRAIISEHEQRLAWRERLSQLAGEVPFPFDTMRPHQDEMVRRIEAALGERTHTLVSAPTGIGKTAASLWPAVRHAMRDGLRVFFLTSKTTQQHIVVETLRSMQPPRDGFVALHLRAREKMCANDVYFCHPEFCRFARGYYERLANSTALDDLAARGIITPEDCYDRAVEETLCPFELALDVSLRADVIVCDYNYVFDPAVFLRRFFQDRRYDDIILIIDEAPNLYARGREYYSPQLHRAGLREAIALAERTQAPVFGRLANWCRDLDDELDNVSQQKGGEDAGQQKYLVEPDKAFFAKQRELLDDIVLEYAEHCRVTATLGPNDPVRDLFRAVIAFNNVLQLVGDEFSYIWDGTHGSGSLNILCKDPSSQLGRRLEGCYAAVGMSATLVPITFYRHVLGFDPDRTDLVVLPSPFPKEHLRVLVEPKIPTRYRQRARSYEPIARLVEQVAAARPGNYFVFFPSFDYLDAVAAHLAPGTMTVLRQERSMSERKRAELIERLRDEQRGHLVLAVQGGIFAEGVDYPGGMLIGVMIVGPGLPRVCFEQELMRRYFEQHHDMGFEYAYLFVGMNRVIQSVGRLIRSEHDTGVAVLIGQRFATPPYAALFPPYWYDASPDELVSRNITQDVAAFWRDTL